MNISAEKKNRTLYLALDRPSLNVLNLPLLGKFSELLDPLKHDKEVDFVVLRGRGRAFSAGVDVGDHTREKVPAMLEAMHAVIRTLLEIPQVTLCVVDGVCLGGGCELASSCDFILASEESSFGTPEINVGCYPPVALARFPSQLGYHRAAEMILTGKRLSAQEALSIGLVNRVVPSGDLDPALEVFLDELRGKSAAVLRITVKGLREIAFDSFSEALKKSEQIYLEELLRTEDVEEGVQAFLEKRKPRWSHR